jgi:hypothetical protein
VSYYTSVELSWDGEGITIDALLKSAKPFIKKAGWAVEDVLETLGKLLEEGRESFNRLYSEDLEGLFLHLSKAHKKVSFWIRAWGEEHRDVWLREFQDGKLVLSAGPFQSEKGAVHRGQGKGYVLGVDEPPSFTPGRSHCLHCGKVLNTNKDVIQFEPYFVPPWELLCNPNAIAFHSKCWRKWDLRDRFMRRVNATSDFLVRADGSWTFDFSPQKREALVTLMEGQAEGTCRNPEKVKEAAVPWSATLWLDYLEETRFRVRFKLNCEFQMVETWVIIDAPSLKNKKAALNQALSAVTRGIEEQLLGKLFKRSEQERAKLFQLKSATWGSQIAGTRWPS